MKIKDKYINFIEGMKKVVVSDDLRCKVSFYIISAALSLIAIVMSVVNRITGEHVMSICSFIFALLCILNIFVLHFFRIREIAVYLAFSIETMILLTFFIISGVAHGFGTLWICMIPSFAMLIFGTLYGIVFSMTAFVIIAFLFWTPVGRDLLIYSYNEAFMLRFPLLFCAIFLVALLIEYVRKETHEQFEDTKRQYSYLYRHDALTGLFNRYGINEFMENTFNKDSNQHVSVIIMDIDNFKKINDVYGHECGDEVLKKVASIPPKIMCQHCQCCRWGGEEFLMIMQCDHDAVLIAEKIRQEIEQTTVLYNDTDIHVTVSIGVCIADTLSGANIHDIINQADKHMYYSKQNGKNRVTSCTLSLDK